MPTASSELTLLNASEIARLLVMAREGDYNLRNRALKLIARLPVAQDAWRELCLPLMDQVGRLAIAERSYHVPTVAFQEALKLLAVAPLPEAKQFLRELKEQGSAPQRELVRKAEEAALQAVSTWPASPPEQPRPEVDGEDRARADALAEPWLNPDSVPPFPDAETFGLLRAVSPPVARRLATQLFSVLSPGGVSQGGWESNALVAWIAGLQSEFSPDVARLFEAYCSQENPDIRQQIAWASSRAPLRDILVQPGARAGEVTVQFLEHVLSFTDKASPPLVSIPSLFRPGVSTSFGSMRESVGTGNRNTRALLDVRYKIPEAHAARPMLLGLSAPSHVAPRSRFTVRFVALVQRLKAELPKLLVERSLAAPHTPEPQVGAWQPGTSVRIQLSGPYLKARPALPGRDSFTWNGSCEIIDFEVDVHRAAPRGSTTELRGEVSVMGVRVAVLEISLLFAGKSDFTPRPMVTVTSAFSKAFASYAPENKDEVSLIASRLAHQTGMELFMDRVDLHAGPRWREHRREAIRACPHFVLFWSSHACKSPWVTWEWRTALEIPGGIHLSARFLEPVRLAPLPKELASLDFDDSTAVA